MLLYISLFSISFLILAWKRIDWSVMAMLIGLPAYLIRFKIAGLPFTLLELMIVMNFLVWLVKHTEFKNYITGKNNIKTFLDNRKKRLSYPFGLEIIALLIISLIAAGVAGFNNTSLGIWKAYFFEPALFFILILNLFYRDNSGRDVACNVSTNAKNALTFEKIIFSLAISAFFISVFAIYQKFTGAFITNPLWAAEETRRVISFFDYPNAVGLYLAPIIILIIGYLFNMAFDLFPTFKISNFKFQISKQFSISKFLILKIIFLKLTVFLSLMSIYFARSEGALIGIIAGLFVFGLLAGKRSKLATIAITAIFALGIFSYGPIRTYAIDKITLNDFSGQVRKLQWIETWEMLTDKTTTFIFGSGLSNYQNAILPFHQDGFFYNKDKDPEFHRHTVWDEAYRKAHWQPLEIYLYPHNILLNFWVELGLIGMLLFVWIIIKFFVFSISNFKFQISNLRTNNFKYLNIGLICAMIVIIVHGLVDVPYFKNDLAVMFWLFVAMMSLINLKITSKGSYNQQGGGNEQKK